MREDLVALLKPAGTLMDLNIGAALSLAAKCRGVLKRLAPAIGGDAWMENSSNISAFEVVSRGYTSAARVILMGHGADEQCGGYRRHVTKFREGGWSALAREV